MPWRGWIQEGTERRKVGWHGIHGTTAGAALGAEVSPGAGARRNWWTKILEAVRTAPTAGNFQAYEIYVVSGAARMRALAAAAFNHDWIAQAPMALVVCTHAARCEYDPKEHWALQDASIAATLGASGDCGPGTGDLLGGSVSSGEGCRGDRGGGGTRSDGGAAVWLRG